MYQRILVPFDGSTTSSKGLDEAIRLATLTGARLRLIHLLDVLAFATGFETYSAYADSVIPFMHQTGEQPVVAHAIQGPLHPELGIAMDMSIQLKVPSGAILTLSLSFNNNGPFGSFFRYICDNGTYKALYDDLVNGKDEPIDVSRVDVSLNGIELEDREFFAAIKEGRQVKSSVEDVLPAMRVLGLLEERLSS